jgi:hypothetical protein
MGCLQAADWRHDGYWVSVIHLDAKLFVKISRPRPDSLLLHDGMMSDFLFFALLSQPLFSACSLHGMQPLIFQLAACMECCFLTRQAHAHRILSANLACPTPFFFRT